MVDVLRVDFIVTTVHTSQQSDRNCRKTEVIQRMLVSSDLKVRVTPENDLIAL